MEELPTDVEMAENGGVYGVYDDEFYESIQAPMYVDFTLPLLPIPDDSPSWFCARIGCTKKHDPELDPDTVSRNFMLRVMAARSPNVRCRKIWNTEKTTGILKCPLSAPPKSSKPKMTLLSCIGQKQGAKSKVTHVSSKYMSSNGVKAQGKEKVLVMEGCGSNPEVEGSMKGKNKRVVKELIFPSSLKDDNQETSTSASVADVTAEMKKLKVKRPARIVPSRYATYFSQLPKHSCDAVEKSKQAGSTVPCKDTGSKKAVAKNMIDGKEEENKPKGKVYGLRRAAEEKASRNCSKDSDVKGVESLPLQAVETSEKKKIDATKGSNIPTLKGGGEGNATKKAVVAKRVLAGKEKEKKPAGKVFGLRRDVAKLDWNSKVEKKPLTNCARDPVFKVKESLPLPRETSTGKKTHTSDVTMEILPLVKEEKGSSEREKNEQTCHKIDGLKRDALNSVVEEKASAKYPEAYGEECIPLSPAETSTGSEKNEQPCQKIDGLKREALNSVVEEKASAKYPEGYGEECIPLSPEETSTEREKVDASDATRVNIPPLEGDLARVRISSQAAGNETIESEDKENVTASDCNRNPNLTAPEAARSSKKLKERVLASSQGGGKTKKPIIMPTKPKAFRLRTDERSILKEMNLEKRRLLQPTMMPSCSSPFTKIDSKNTKHENLRKFKRGHPI